MIRRWMGVQSGWQVKENQEQMEPDTRLRQRVRRQDSEPSTMQGHADPIAILA